MNGPSARQFLAAILTGRNPWDFHHRYALKHEPGKAGWVSPADFEPPGFNPERPLQTP